jgi:hypothetical protein
MNAPDVEWITVATIVGMSVVMIVVGGVCSLIAWVAHTQADAVRAQRDLVAMRASDASRRIDVLTAARAQDLAAYQRRVDRWRTAFLDLHEQALQMARLVHWHTEVPEPPRDTAFDDLSDTVPGQLPEN